MDWKRLEARYAKLEWRQRLGNLASTLARAATAADNPRTAASVPDLLREGMWVIEWGRADTPLDVLVELGPLQKEMGLLKRAWDQDSQAVRPLLVFRSRVMSDQVLKLLGLVQSPIQAPEVTRQ